jgi:hypothetical protein
VKFQVTIGGRGVIGNKAIIDFHGSKEYGSKPIDHDLLTPNQKENTIRGTYRLGL